MSGYLGRLIDTAAGRGNSLRPMIGSIFSSHQTPAHSGDERESVSAHPSPADPGPAIADPHEPRDVAPKSLPTPLLPPAVHSVSFSRPEIARPPRNVHSSNAEPAVDFDESPAPAARTRRAAKLESGGEETSHNRPPDEHDDDGRRPRGDGNQISHPLMKPMGGLDVTGSDARSMPNERHAAQNAREPDEIQIHIGRIEVIAMQQPAPPRQAKAPPQSMTLDSFLSRRDGKSR
jgi:hypothetical protein